MKHKRDIRPITYLKNNTADLIREVSDNGRTVLITQNGEAKAVVMDVELYDRWKASLAMLRILAQSEAEFEAGKVVSQKDAFTRAEAAIRRAERDG
jgi:prevent-host-death family protein